MLKKNLEEVIEKKKIESFYDWGEKNNFLAEQKVLKLKIQFTFKPFNFWD